MAKICTSVYAVAEEEVTLYIWVGPHILVLWLKRSYFWVSNRDGPPFKFFLTNNNQIGRTMAFFPDLEDPYSEVLVAIQRWKKFLILGVRFFLVKEGKQTKAFVLLGFLYTHSHVGSIKCGLGQRGCG